MWAQLAYAASTGTLTAIVFYFAGAAHARPHSKPICRSNRRHPPRLPLSAILAVRRSLQKRRHGSAHTSGIDRPWLLHAAGSRRCSRRWLGSASQPVRAFLCEARRGCGVERVWRSRYGDRGRWRMHAWAVRPCAIRRVADSTASTGARCMLYVVCQVSDNSASHQQCLRRATAAAG